MAVNESNISHNIMKSACKAGCTLFKNARGQFRSMDGKRIVTAGLSASGSSDLIGGTQVKIRQDMVGKTVFIFTAIEVKTASGSVQKNQTQFLDFIKKSGGIAGVARSPDDAVNLILAAGDF